jgi:YidC/Oxa1 family membrane protein insertase
MEKRVLIAVILSIAVMYGYSILFPPPKQLQPEKAQASAVSQQTEPVQVKNILLPGEALSPVAGKIADNTKDVSVETDVFRAEFSVMGGALKKLTLKQYKDKVGAAGKEIILVNEGNHNLFTLATEYPGFSSSPIQYSATSSEKLTLSGAEKKSIDFSFVTPTGVHLIKRFTFSGSSYGITLDNIIQNRSASVQDGSLLTVLRNHSVKPKEEEGRFEVFGPAILSESGMAFDSITDLAKAEKTYSKAVKWTGFGDKYFLDALLAKDNSILSVSMKDANGVLEQRISSAKISLKSGTESTVSYNFYIGPKDIDILKAQGERLEESIDLGWFAIIAKPLLHSIKLFYGYLHNYGLAIILITVILKIFFFPLTHKSYKSMKEMQKLQPKMQELKEKFKDDKDGLNRSVMELYKTHKVNPLGGCLPMIVQIPVFFGLYKALMFSVELRHAPFYFWIQDLSAKDPYYITPIIMGATMFIQQKMTPTNMDPMQAKMMLALPVVFTAMFLNFPSGLVLYWLVNNVLTIAQQMYINKSLKEA